MAKKFWVILIIFLLLLSIAGVWVVFMKKDDTGAGDNIKVGDNAKNDIGMPQNHGNLGGHECLDLFSVRRGEELAASQEILTVESLKTFRSGAFFGKISNFQAGQNQQFASVISRLMREGKIATYEHLQADVCLYHQDLLNPENGATLNYYVEHLYCTNHCQTGKYEIEVNLDAEGNFVGYRQGNIY